MLRLEKRRQEIHVQLRDRPRHLDRAFLMALGIALGIHALAAVLFYIKPFILSHDAVLAPLVVETEFPQAEEVHSTLAISDREGKAPRYALEPTYSDFQLPQLPAYPVKQQVASRHPSDLLNPFESIETDWQQLLTRPHSFVQPVSPSIAIAGPLANRQLLNNGIDRLSSAPTRLTGTIRYDVRVDATSGQIFWYAPQFSTRQPTLERAAEQLLLAMRFAPDPESFVFNGEVAIQFGRLP